MRERRARTVLGLLLAAGLLALVFWGVPLSEVLLALRLARPEGLLAVALLFLLQQALRALRQKLVLDAAAPPLPYRSHLAVLCISFLAINSLPGRVGEVVRPLLLLERHGLPFGKGVAVVVVERALDLLATLAMLSLVLAALPDPPGMATLPASARLALDTSRQLALLALPALPLGFALLVFQGEGLLARLQPLAERGSARRRARLGRLLGFARAFLGGLRALREPGRLLLVLGLTALTWAGSVWMFPLMAWSFGFGPLVGYLEGLGLLVFSMLGGVVPAAPGGLGTYEAALRGGLLLYGVAGPGPTPAGGSSLDAAAIAFALTLHWWIYLVQAASAVYFLLRDRVDPRALLARARAALRGEEGAPAG